MSTVPLRVGPVELDGYDLVRSGFRWLHPEGHVCRPGEPIAFCNVGLQQRAAARSGAMPFMDEHRDLQMVFATRVGGRLRQGVHASRGGFLDQLSFMRWSGDFSIGSIERDGSGAPEDADPGLLRVMMAAGRRMTELAEIRSGLMTGWHDRSRAWWGEGDAATGTLLSVATCEQTGLIKGASSGFIELFNAVRGPAQVVLTQEEPLVPCARVLAEQITRTDDERRTIAEDMARTFALGPELPVPSDWLFMGALATALNRTALLESYPVLTRNGLRQAAPAAAILLSLGAEVRDVARHRRLGYTIGFHDFRLVQAGPGVGQWLRANFVRVRRTPEEIRQDYLLLLQHLKATTGARLIVLNSYSAPVFEDIANYAGIAHPMSTTLGSIRAKELNLMLHDLARDHPLDILDLDAAVARLGVRDHMPDGTHFGGRLQAELRAELLGILQDRGIAGFSPR